MSHKEMVADIHQKGKLGRLLREGTNSQDNSSQATQTVFTLTNSRIPNGESSRP